MYVKLSIPVCHSCLRILICSLMVANKSIVKCELGVYIFLREHYLYIDNVYMLGPSPNKRFIDVASTWPQLGCAKNYKKYNK